MGKNWTHTNISCTPSNQLWIQQQLHNHQRSRPSEPHLHRPASSTRKPRLPDLLCLAKGFHHAPVGRAADLTVQNTGQAGVQGWLDQSRSTCLRFYTGFGHYTDTPAPVWGGYLAQLNVKSTLLFYVYIGTASIIGISKAPCSVVSLENIMYMVFPI